MRLPIVCLDQRLRQYLALFSGCFSRPQYKYFVTILLGLMLCQSGRTLSGLLQVVNSGVSLSGASRFMSEAPWHAEDLAQKWQRQFRQEMTAQVLEEQARSRCQGKKKRGRPKKTVVTEPALSLSKGYLIGDDSTMSKRRGKKMEGIGRHYSGSEKKRVTGHSLVQGLYVLLGRRCPLAPRMYRQRAVCEAEGVTFASKVDLMAEIISTFEPVAGTITHVLLDSWYTSKRLWKIARERGFLITSGLRCNRLLRIEDPEVPNGWRWQRVDEYAAALSQADWQWVCWPNQNGNRWVYVHVVSTRIKTLYRCQLVIVRGKWDDDEEERTLYWASSDLSADLPTLVSHIAARWDVEVLFADTKELLGLDHYQLMSATAIVRFWTLVMLAYYFLDQERDRYQRLSGRHLTIGDAWRQVQRTHWQHSIDWIHQRFRFGDQPADLFLELTGESL
jgi:SRSO17 transposase